MDIGFSVIVFLLQIFIGILFAILSVYLGLRFYDKMTKGIDEIKELKRGNPAVAIILAALILSIGNIVQQGVKQFDNILLKGVSLPLFIVSFILAIVHLGIVILIAILTIYIAIRILDSMTVGIDELGEIKKGNVAVAILVASVVYLVSLVVSGAIGDISNLSIFNPETIASMLGL
ncbi:MAG: DUF350 domain-containing protein [Candidatus Micrarchaeota archaeon]|nr:DUF350 domain-containing protein [Candidatus Micrarchaeota archaeon]